MSVVCVSDAYAVLFLLLPFCVCAVVFRQDRSLPRIVATKIVVAWAAVVETVHHREQSRRFIAGKLEGLRCTSPGLPVMNMLG